MRVPYDLLGNFRDSTVFFNIFRIPCLLHLLARFGALFEVSRALVRPDHSSLGGGGGELWNVQCGDIHQRA